MSFAALAAILLVQVSEPSAYQLDIVVVKDGVETVAAQTQIILDTPSNVTIQTADAAYTLEANLFTVQGDGASEVLQLEANITAQNEFVLAPSATFLRGQPFHFRSGQPDKDMVKLDLTPLPTSDQ